MYLFVYISYNARYFFFSSLSLLPTLKCFPFSIESFPLWVHSLVLPYRHIPHTYKPLSRSISPPIVFHGLRSRPYTPVSVPCRSFGHINLVTLSFLLFYSNLSIVFSLKRSETSGTHPETYSTIHTTFQWPPKTHSVLGYFETQFVRVCCNFGRLISEDKTQFSSDL